MAIIQLDEDYLSDTESGSDSDSSEEDSGQNDHKQDELHDYIPLSKKNNRSKHSIEEIM